MDQQLWSRLSPLLDELLDLPLPEREQRLAALRAEDAALAERLAAMLAHDAELESQGFLDAPAAQAVVNTLADDEAPPDLSGQRIGPYELQRELGQGGMGSVWLARRVDGRFEGHVAVKFLKSGLFSSGNAGRFAREGQILGRLSHPHIARLLDAGVHEGGQPYLVLEYVEGLSIDKFCQQQGLDVPARIRLFQGVLSAVAHAHSRLILHRDLKPSNILVNADGQVKLLDFGIAKLLDDATQGQEGAAATELTQRAGSAFTPQFAAPEQVQQADVTTATDVYALGVLLYLLLGGRHPTEGRTTTSQLDRLKAVVETEPRRLSSAAVECTDPAIVRQAKLLKGDLDTIVAKALKKKPSERYANAQALADELQRWLAHEPISARPDSRLYVLGRFVRRHRWAVGFGSMAVLALAGLTGVSVWQAQRAEAAQLQAQARQRQAEDVLSFMLGEFADKLRPIGRLELLDSVGGKALGVLDQAGSLSPADRLQRAKALTVIGEVRVSKRDVETALEPLRTATELLRGPPPDKTVVPSWRKAQGAAAFWQGEAYFQQIQFQQAQKFWLEYRDVSAAWLAAIPDDAEAQLELSYAHSSLGSLHLGLGDFPAAEEAFNRSLALKEALLNTRSDDAALLSDWSDTVSWLGRLLELSGRHSSATRAYLRALPRVQALRQRHPTELKWLKRETNLLHGLAKSQMSGGDSALATLRQARAAAEQLKRGDPANVGWAFLGLQIDISEMKARPDLSPASRAQMALGLLSSLDGLRGGKPPLDGWLLDRVRLIDLVAMPPCSPADCQKLEAMLQPTEQRLDAMLSMQAAAASFEALTAAVQLQLLKSRLHAADKLASQEACNRAQVLMQLRGGWLRSHAELTRHWLQVQTCLDPKATERTEWQTAQTWLHQQRDL